jgi:uncharacterized protein YjbJ (UPF0337 family)
LFGLNVVFIGCKKPEHKKKGAVMNKDQFKGRWTQFKGELKKQWGKFTDDDLLQIEGDYQKFQGTLQAKYGDQKKEVGRWADQWFERQEAEAEAARKRKVI